MINDIKCSRLFVSHILLFCFLYFGCCYADDLQNINSEQNQLMVPIGLVRDMYSTFDIMVNLCIEMAISDFYSAHPNYRTRVRLQKKEAKRLLDVDLAVQELVKHEEVLGILGLHGLTEEALAAALGEKAGVLILSFTSRSSYTKNRYFVRTTVDDSVQAQALAAICQNFNWPGAVILYEDTVSGNIFLSHLINAFQDAEIRLSHATSISISSEDTHILKELNNLKMKETRVFLVHMNPKLGERLFALAKIAGMMSKDYAWIITDRLSIFLNSMDPDSRDPMDGVLGIRPHVFPSKKLKSFRERWKRNTLSNNDAMELNIYGLWAYDALTALAIAAEKTIDDTGFQISSFRSIFLSELLSTKFRGLAGDFEVNSGVLKPSAFEIFNLIGNGEKVVGFWTPERGILREMSKSGESMSINSRNELKSVVWPGDSTVQPSGWSISATGKLRVGVPWKPGFKQFVNVTIDPVTNITHATGFVVDIFLEALKVLPFSIDYEFICYNDSNLGKRWAYDNMLHRIPEDYDMVVADTTIWAPRSLYVDFSLPYSESGVIMVAKNKKPVDWWIFIKPLRWDLWVAIIVACILMGVTLHILERQESHNGEESVTSHVRQPGMVYWSPISILAFQERNMVKNNWSVFVLVCWLFMAFILMQSFTANLSAILTVDQLKSSLSKDYKVGYHVGSFMETFLTDKLNISVSRLKPYASIQEFHDALTKGSKNKGVDVVVDETPYMKLLMSRYQSQYKKIGPTYRTDGLGFAFPVSSPLVASFSRAILNVTQGPLMSSLEQKNFGPAYSSQDPLSSVITQGSSSLTLAEFAGLFLLIGSLTLFALFCSETKLGRKFIKMTEHLIQRCFAFFNPQVHSMERARGDGGAAEEAIELSDGGAAEEAIELIRERSNTHPHGREGEETDETSLNDETRG